MLFNLFFWCYFKVKGENFWGGIGSEGRKGGFIVMDIFFFFEVYFRVCGRDGFFYIRFYIFLIFFLGVGDVFCVDVELLDW